MTTLTPITFHALTPGDVVSAYGTELLVLKAYKDQSSGVARTLVEWIDLNPEERRTYSGPWTSGLALFLTEPYPVVFHAER